MRSTLAVGIMSGTSLDGVDAVIVEIKDTDGSISTRIIESITKKYDSNVREEILKVCDPETADLRKICSLNIYLGREFGRVTNELLAKAKVSCKDISFISSHGQTIYHQPFNGDGEVDVAGTLQIGDISVLSEETGIAVVGDFRTADMAVGGQGAPLVSYVDSLLFQDKERSRAIQNIGGIGNVTFLPADSNSESIQSFDTGPGNMVIDEVIARLTNGSKSYDHNGNMARNGNINETLLEKLMEHEYFQLQPPKTTGRELFGKSFAKDILNENNHLSTEDLVATVSEWTALTIAKSYKDFIINRNQRIDEVILGGGGSYNSFLVDRLKHHLPNSKIFTHEHFGISSDYKEALAFAVLGYQSIQAKHNQVPSATGANKQVIMGKVAYTQPDAYKRMHTGRRVNHE